MPTQKKRRSRSGAVAVEFALVLPIFCLLVFGTVELGRAVMVYQILTNGAREGARYAIVPDRTNEEIEEVVNDYFADSTISGHSVAIDPEDVAGAASGTKLTVTVSVPFADVAWGSDWLGMGDETFSVSVSMRKE
jgi:Flp pilus assembly protein TadG